MPAIQVFSGQLADELRRELVYAGDLLVFKGVEPMAELCALTDELIRETLGALDPVRAQFELDREDYVTRVGELQKLYRQHGHAKRLFLAALGCVGVDLRRTCGSEVACTIRDDCKWLAQKCEALRRRAK